MRLSFIKLRSIHTGIHHKLYELYGKYMFTENDKLEFNDINVIHYRRCCRDARAYSTPVLQ
jgi:hypothetical protein